jgi:regulator of ribonuclease activity A
MSHWSTADLCDTHGELARIATHAFHDFGGVPAFHGEIATLLVSDDYRPVRDALEAPGGDRVLVVDAGGAVTRAILGDRLLTIAANNGWAGVVINGAVRDTAVTKRIAVGLRALGTSPQRGESGAPHDSMVPVTFAGIRFVPGEWLYADEDGIIVANHDLLRAQ